jgi:hypothetical protein
MGVFREGFLSRKTGRHQQRRANSRHSIGKIPEVRLILILDQMNIVDGDAAYCGQLFIRLERQVLEGSLSSMNAFHDDRFDRRMIRARPFLQQPCNCGNYVGLTGSSRPVQKKRRKRPSAISVHIPHCGDCCGNTLVNHQGVKSQARSNLEWQSKLAHKKQLYDGWGQSSML